MVIRERRNVVMAATDLPNAEDDGLHQALLAYVRQEFEAPVAAIIGYAEIMLEDAERSGTEHVLADLERIRKAGLALKELLANALDLPQVEGDFADFRRTLRHDLRTPLTAIKGFGEMLLEDAQECGNEALVDDLQKLLDAGSHLLAQIDSIIDFSGFPEQGRDLDSSENHAANSIMRFVQSVSPQEASAPSRILIVDDTQATRELLSRRLSRDGHYIKEASNGLSALQLIASEPFDLILLDMMMPDISGYEVLMRLKADNQFRHIPVIVISALDQIDSIVRCIEAGAEDYLSKPFDPVLLRARIGASLEKKRLRDREQAAIAELTAEKERSEALLLNILPKSVIVRMNNGETSIADDFSEVTVLFSDIVGFTRMSMRRSAGDVVAILNGIFSAVDRLALELGIEKIKTIGDAYMAVAGLPEPRVDHVEVIAKLALSMRDLVGDVARRYGEELKVRIGIHTGEIVAGVIGTHKFAYDVWGDTVNTASAMESHGIPNEIQVSKESFSRLFDHFVLDARGLVNIKGKGPMETFLLRGERTKPN
jgi:adenylate cyclase